MSNICLVFSDCIYHEKSVSGMGLSTNIYPHEEFAERDMSLGLVVTLVELFKRHQNWCKCLIYHALANEIDKLFNFCNVSAVFYSSDFH